MKMQILFVILFTFIIKESLSDESGSRTTYEFKIDLKKYEKVTVPSTEDHIIFDSSDFKKGEEIYFKVTADSFNEDYLLYKFYDDGASMANPVLDTYKKASPSKTDNEYDHGEIVSVTKYFTIKKDERDLGSLEGKYLVIVFYCTGNVLIENTKENEGKTTMIVIIVVVVVVVIAVAICIFCYCKRRKALANGTTTNEVYVGNNDPNYNMNTGNNANVYNKNYNNNNYNNNNYNNNNYNNNNYNNNNYNNNNYNNNNYNSNNNF
jgi:hypothetical protein